MRTINVTLDQQSAALGKLTDAVPGYMRGLQLAGMRSLDPGRLVTRIDTQTLQSSEAPFHGEPEQGARGLEYGEGHTPLPEGFREAAVKSAGDFGVVGSVNDAQSPGGFNYGAFWEERDGDHRRAHRRMGGVLTGAAVPAMEQAQREVGL